MYNRLLALISIKSNCDLKNLKLHVTLLYECLKSKMLVMDVHSSCDITIEMYKRSCSRYLKNRGKVIIKQLCVQIQNICLENFEIMNNFY